MRKEKLFTTVGLLALLLVLPTNVSANSASVNATSSLSGQLGDAEESKPVVPFAKVSDFELSQKTAKKGETISYRFTLEDLGTNTHMKEGFEEFDKEIYSFKKISEVHLYWYSSGKQYIEQVVSWKPETGKNAMTIEGKIPVIKGMQPGAWHLHSIELSDVELGPWSKRYYDLYSHLNLDSEGEYDGAEVDILDSRDKKTASQKDLNNPNIDFQDFSALDFEVKGTKADNKAPTIDLKSLKLSKKKAGNKYRTFSIKVKDDSKITDVIAGFDGIWYYRMKYNKKKKCYECKVSVREAQLDQIQVRDNHGNYKMYSAYNNKKYKKAFKKIRPSKK